ncbi:FG-GAP-like repeat-containing protein [Dyadobacter chenwenxiniae]|uniref:FG-GAP-like repeat-containing protein n=1 Tax=Dyadobacter chenwenxiniae TaxID=2906456 RepID=A0A9X1TFY5_9BACT|nr:FG-GAP-like repeat-containing protein [Dyadobacter chenwenxiniae]MCF0063477.1 FG-GAP-like repeat-containing protein [Dyadobacter chenwenxiniae]UON85144.1 FG-GAP-like repeat-containing protein [Dyadobacter chenwenxiniae]
MKQLYRRGMYAILLMLFVAAYVVKMQELSSGKPIPAGPAPHKTKPIQAKPGAVHDSTMNSIQRGLARREYNISLDPEKNVLQSPNRKQGLRAYYKPGVLTMRNRVDSAGHDFSLKLVNTGIFADGRQILSAQPNATTESVDNRLLIKHKGFTEEFVNNEEGVRQNFIISSAPVNTKELQVRVSVNGLKVNDLKNNALQFYAENKKGKLTNSLIYKDIKCWDADGKILPATLRYEDGLVMLSANVQNAAYPVTIDPIVVNGNPTNAKAIVEGNQIGAQAGYAVSSAGDVNGDGYSDVLVGAPFFDSGETNEGVVFVYHGSASGLSANAVVTLQSNQNEAQFGTSVSSAGDLNKDGYSDVIIGAPFYTKGETKEGAAMVYYGSALGLNSAATILESNQSNAKFGRAVEGLGDVNDDGFSDVIVGAPLYDKGQIDEGAVFIYHGSAVGINLLAANMLESNQVKAQYGYVSAGAGDVNGDGYNDVLVGAYAYDKGHDNEGAVFVHLGSAVGINNNASVVLEGNQINAQYGWSAATAGDVNGDGYSDIMVGSYLYDYGQTNEGAVFVYHGSAQGIKASAAIRLESNQPEAKQGIAVACAGDVNGDGYSDVMIGIWQYDKVESNEGAVVLHHGSPSGLISSPASTLESNQADAGLGWSVKSAGDVNGDGYSDIVTGANTYDKGQVDEGAAFVWLGMADGVSAAPVVTLEGNQEGAQFGFSVASAGDVNGDGYGDIIIGAKYYDNGTPTEGAAFIYYGSKIGLNQNTPAILESNDWGAYMGWSVSGGGDVNGDGFSDVVVGAPAYSGNGNAPGAAFIYHGSAAGIIGAPASILTPLKSGYFGASVSDAGDLNGDGFSDVVVGAFGQNNKGAFSVFYGSSLGINPNTEMNVEGNQAFAEFGWKVSKAGDVNGDGYADLIIGAHFLSNGESKEGQVLIYHGSSSGILKVPNNILEINEANACFGADVSNAGDINGDGFGDILAGSSGYSTGNKMISAAVRIYYGSASGILAASVVKLEGSSGGPILSHPVASAGDVNGDGYSDIALGANYKISATYVGNIFLYLGSNLGITSSLPSQIISCPSPELTSVFGHSIASAGDVNGDGFADLLVGVPYENSGSKANGEAFIFQGNGTIGLQNNLRLYNSNLITIITQSQKAQNNFGAGLYAKSFLGRNKGKLVWETKAKGEGFSKASNNMITNSTQSTSSQSGYVDLGLSGKELKNLIDKQGPSTKVRVRVKYDRTLALTGQLYGPWRYLPSYLVGNSIAPAPEDVVDDMSETVKRKVEESLAGKAGELIYVYPNPASDRLVLKSDGADRIKNVQMLTVEGRSVYRSSTPVSEIDVRNVAAGNYILLITHLDGSTSTRKVVIEK